MLEAASNSNMVFPLLNMAMVNTAKFTIKSTKEINIAGATVINISKDEKDLFLNIFINSFQPSFINT